MQCLAVHRYVTDRGGVCLGEGGEGSNLRNAMDYTVTNNWHNAMN